MSVEKLQNDHAFQLLLMLRHDEILSFVQEELRSRTVTMRIFYLLNVIFIASLVVFAVIDLQNPAIRWGSMLGFVSLGMLLALTILIPLHEGIHGLAYKLIGAPSVSFGVNWNKFYFFAVADRFVVKRNAFVFIGLAPFFVITLLAAAGFFLVGPEMKWAFLGVLVMHTGACAGDFAMVSFYEKYRSCPEMLTYDDLNRKVSFFYVKLN